jgi:hypothetical protein
MGYNPSYLMLAHGVLVRGVPPRHTYEFWWCGERIDIADFNERLANQTKSAMSGAGDVLEGMNLKESINEGEKTVAKIEQIEEILKLPLCQKCRSMIGGDIG